jgi:hypothetical protein
MTVRAGLAGRVRWHFLDPRASRGKISWSFDALCVCGCESGERFKMSFRRGTARCVPEERESDAANVFGSAPRSRHPAT